MNYRQILQEAHIKQSILDIVYFYCQVPSYESRADEIVTALYEIDRRLIVNEVIDCLAVFVVVDDPQLYLMPIGALKASKIKFTQSVLDAFISSLQKHTSGVKDICELLIALHEVNPDILQSASEFQKIGTMLGASYFNIKLSVRLLTSINSQLKALNRDHLRPKITPEFIVECIKKRVYQLDAFCDAFAELIQLAPGFLYPGKLHHLLLYFEYYEEAKKGPFSDKTRSYLSKRLSADRSTSIASIENALKAGGHNVKVLLAINLLQHLLSKYPQDVQSRLTHLIDLIFVDLTKLSQLPTILKVFVYENDVVAAETLKKCIEIWVALDAQQSSALHEVINTFFSRMKNVPSSLLQAILILAKESPTTFQTLRDFCNQLQEIKHEAICLKFFNSINEAIKKQEHSDLKKELSDVLTQMKAEDEELTRQDQKKQFHDENHKRLVAELDGIVDDFAKVNSIAEFTQAERRFQTLREKIPADEKERYDLLSRRIDRSEKNLKKEIEGREHTIQQERQRAERDAAIKQCVEDINQKLKAVSYFALRAAATEEQINREARSLQSTWEQIKAEVPQELASDPSIVITFQSVQSQFDAQIKQAQDTLRVEVKRLVKIKKLCSDYLAHIHKVKQSWYIFDEPNLQEKEKIFKELATIRTVEEAKAKFATPENLAILRHSRSPKLYQIVQAIAFILTLPIAFFVLLATRPSVNFFRSHGDLAADKIEHEIETEIAKKVVR